jgi:hypothetical protein
MGRVVVTVRDIHESLPMMVVTVGQCQCARALRSVIVHTCVCIEYAIECVCVRACVLLVAAAEFEAMVP